MSGFMSVIKLNIVLIIAPARLKLRNFEYFLYYDCKLQSSIISRYLEL